MSEPINIAIVDDEEEILTLFEISLKKEIRGKIANIYFFNRAKGCLDFFEEKKNEIKIVLLVSDINMPGMDGYGLLERVKTDYPEIKVVMASAYGSTEYIERANNLGADGFLTKPIDFEYLKKIIREEYDKFNEE